MARSINREVYGSQGEVLPKLTAEMIPGRRTVLTIASVREVTTGKYGAFWAVKFEEFPEHELVTNATIEDAFIALVDAGQLPDDFDAWTGYRVAMFKKKNTNPDTKEVVEKLYPMDPEDQEEAIAAFDAHVKAQASAPTAPKGKGATAPAAAPATAPRGAKQTAGRR